MLPFLSSSSVTLCTSFLLPEGVKRSASMSPSLNCHTPTLVPPPCHTTPRRAALRAGYHRTCSVGRAEHTPGSGPAPTPGRTRCWRHRPSLPAARALCFRRRRRRRSLDHPPRPSTPRPSLAEQNKRLPFKDHKFAVIEK